MGSSQKAASDGTDETCSYTQVRGICSTEKTLFVSNVATGCFKLVSGLTGTVSFLQSLEVSRTVLVSEPKA